MSNPLSKLIEPWYPATAVGLERGLASMVQLEGGRRNRFAVRRAASLALPDELIVPGFGQSNISDLTELAESLRDLAVSAGLVRQRKWSVTLPEASTRTLIVTIESHVTSKSELDEVLKWKLERGFGAELEELSVSRDRLPNDSQGRERYIAVAVRASVMAEYESVFTALGWRTGLILPRHMGEGSWLTRNGQRGDSLLLSSHREGFTAVIYRDKHPLILRSINCDVDEREDEFYRLMLFYRDRLVSDDAQPSLSRLLVLGEGLGARRAGEIASETLGAPMKALSADEIGLTVPVSDLRLDSIAAPAGLATMHWGA